MNHLRTKLLKLLIVSLLIALTSILLKQFLSKSAMSSSPLPSKTPNKHAIIIGSGLAGLSASTQLLSLTHQIPVFLFERSPKPGGNSIKASSGISGAPTKYQPGPPFSDTSFYSDTFASAGAVVSQSRKEREGLIRKLTDESSEAISWLVKSGVDLSLVTQLGGHSFPRTHRGAGKTPPGMAIVATLLKTLQENPLFHLETSSIVTKVLKSQDEIVGVEYTSEGATKIIYGPVIFASGGFAGDAEGMLAQYRPDLAGFPSTNEPRPGSQHLLTEVGAQLLDMDLVQVHPTSFVDPKDLLNPVKFLAAEVLRGEGGLLLRGGKRFVNEMETRKNVTDSIIRVKATETSPRQWDVQLILDEGVYKEISSHIDFYVWKGLMKKMTVGELGDSSLSAIQEYATAVAGYISDQFGRKHFGHWKLHDVTPESVVYVGTVTPAVHFTMGGVMISDRSEVLGENGKPIKGLWAAGEVTGGIHGENRLGGSSLLECVVFGRIAGEEVAKILQNWSKE